ncbi:MAG: OmpA family protein, partial [Betaproteobacteria bacterium]
MKKLNTVALLFASAALAAPISAYAQPRTVDNWRASDGTPWRNGTNELCWRDAGWTPATADPACDGAVKPPPPPAPVTEKVTFAADAFFATGSSAL